MGRTAIADAWDVDVDRERIAVPVHADRCPDATTSVAVAVARQAGVGVEFVVASDETHQARREAAVRARCDSATAVGAARAEWRIVPGSTDDVVSYITWSGASLCCVGASHHRQPARLAGCAVPLLVVGPAWRPGGGGVVRHVLAGLSGWRWESLRVATVAASLARRLGTDLTMIQVVEPAWRRVEVPAFAGAHLFWIARELNVPSAMFDTVAARSTQAGLNRFVDADTVVVVGAPNNHRRLLGGVAGRLLRHSPAPVVVVPSNCESRQPIFASRAHGSPPAR
jgi:nucleotide-binding universal stress UspA family protein